MSKYSSGFRQEIDPILGAIGIISGFLLIFAVIPSTVMIYLSWK